MKLIMGRRNLWAFGLSVFLFGTGYTFAQSDPGVAVKGEAKVQRHTLMERFAPDISLSVEERKEKRVRYLADIKMKKSILDTMDISERKRQKLLSDLYKNPFSQRLHKAMADVKFEDESADNKD